jgi:hypothetical protein
MARISELLQESAVKEKLSALDASVATGTGSGISGTLDEGAMSPVSPRLGTGEGGSVSGGAHQWRKLNKAIVATKVLVSVRVRACC